MSDNRFTKDNLDTYLKDLAKEYRKRNGKSVPAEIILIGGASVLINYGFREMTYDLDAIVCASSSMKEAINYVGDKYSLPNGWLNEDFINTDSYSDKIIQYSTHYKEFSNLVSFRTVTKEYLIAMKLMAGRQYKYDLSDVIGILWEHEKEGDPITLERIKEATVNLYGSYEALPVQSREYIEKAISEGDYEGLYQRVRDNERKNKDSLIEFQNEYPNVLKEENVDNILDMLRQKQMKGN